MTQTLTTKIQTMLAVAQTVGAPLFSLDTLLAGAQAVEGKIDTEINAHGGDIFGAFQADTKALEIDLATIDRGARVAMMYVVGGRGGFLPEQFCEYVQEDKGRDALFAAFETAKRHIG